MAQARIAKLLRINPPVQADRGLLSSSGATVPTDGTDGYQTGCIFQHTDGGAGTALYINEGSLTSCDFNAVETPGGATLTLADLADVADAFATRILETGTYQSTAGGGLVLTATNNRPFTIVGDDGGSAITGDVRQVLSRVLVTVDQATPTLNALRGQIKMLDLVDVTGAAVVSPITGYFELTGTGARTLTGHVAAIRCAIEEGASGTTTIAGSSFYAGLEVTLNSSRVYTQTGLMAGIIVNHSGGSSTWPIGMAIDLGTGISATAELSSTGVKVTLPQSTNDAASPTLTGYEVAVSGAMTTATSGTATFNGVKIATPAITQTAGTCASNGVLITGGAITSGTATGINLAGAWTNALTLTTAVNLMKLPAENTAPVVTSGGAVGTHGTKTVAIKILIDTTAYYLLASTVPTYA
jgi:hypothetical protein